MIRGRRAITPREQDVLNALCDGLSDKEIARRLGIAPGTLKAHLNNLFAKFGVESRLKLVVKVLKG